MSTFDPMKEFEDPQVGRLIELTKGYWTIVDEEDYEELNKYKWHVRINKKKRFYAQRYVPVSERAARGFSDKKRYVSMHCELMSYSLGYENGIQVDHKNHQGLDNRRRNLRESDQSSNAANMVIDKMNCYSKYKGVTKRKGSGHFSVSIRKGKKISLGTFIDEIDAAICYDRKAKELFGEFACVNLDWDDGRVLNPFEGTCGPLKLTHEQIKQIYDRLENGDKQVDIAADFGICQSQVSYYKIKRNKMC